MIKEWYDAVWYDDYGNVSILENPKSGDKQTVALTGYCEHLTSGVAAAYVIITMYTLNISWAYYCL